MSLLHSIPEGFILLHDRKGDVLARRDLDPRALSAALEGAGGAPAGLRTLKRDVKTSVFTGITIDGRAVCLKVYGNVRRGRRAFSTHCALWRLGVPVPEPYFLWERSRESGSGTAVGMEDLCPRPELDRWVSERLSAPGGGGAAALEPLSRALGAALRDLHGRGVYLNDLKTCNIFLEGEAPFRFRFVDLDGARTGKPVTLRRRVKNIAQLDRSTPIAAGLRIRRAFFREYSIGLERRTARRLRKAAIASSVRRPVTYVARGGLREEPWPASAREWPR